MCRYNTKEQQRLIDDTRKEMCKRCKMIDERFAIKDFYKYKFKKKEVVI